MLPDINRKCVNRKTSEGGLSGSGVRIGYYAIASNMFINVTLLIIWSVQSYYTDIINEDSSDQKILFKTVRKLFQKSTNKRLLPSSDDRDTALVNSFADFFISKIIKYIVGLLKVCGVEFRNLVELRQEKIKKKKFSRKSLSKSCELLPFYPRSFWKAILPYFFLLWRSSSICPYRPVLCPMHWK